jgi:hypothetical protein
MQSLVSVIGYGITWVGIGCILDGVLLTYKEFDSKEKKKYYRAAYAAFLMERVATVFAFMCFLQFTWLVIKSIFLT